MLFGRIAYWSKAVPPVFNAPEPFPSARLLLGRNMDQMLTRAGGDPTPLDWNLISQFDENYWTTRLNYLLDRHLMVCINLPSFLSHFFSFPASSAPLPRRNREVLSRTIRLLTMETNYHGGNRALQYSTE